jgi:hypothetical protein
MHARLLVIALSLSGLSAAVGCAGAIGEPGVEGTAGGPGGATSSPLLPARLRRLTNAEYDNTVAALLGTAQRLGASFGPDTRQGGFTVNADQRVNSLLAAQLKAAAETLAADAVAKHLPALAPCAASAPGDDCARQFIAAFARRAFRRPLKDDEARALFTVYQAGTDGGGFSDGVELVITAVLQAPSFLYLSELGTGGGATVRLADHEIASVLSYLLTGAPPDDALIAAADAGQLTSPEARQAAARRLLGLPAARAQVRRFVAEWLGLDALSATGKDQAVYPMFAELRPLMQQETDAFVEEAVFADSGTLGRLLTADYTVVDPKLAAFYGAAGGAGARASLAAGPRRGILDQAAFLATHAHTDESAPVKRGAEVRRKLLCQTMPLPQDLNIVVVPPKPDPSLTTRQRFAAHSNNALCAGCHTLIDPIGFSFESFDGMGAYRTTENGKPVDTTGVLTEAEDADGPFADSAALAARLAGSAIARRCFARQLFRFASAQNGDATEAAFVDAWSGLAPDAQDKLLEILVAYAGSDVAVVRRAR